MKSKIADPGLIAAVTSGAISIIEYYFSQGSTADLFDDHGRTLLMLAAARGQIGSCIFLIRNGASLSCRDYSGLDVHDHALRGANPEISNWLAEIQKSNPPESVKVLPLSSVKTSDNADQIRVLDASGRRQIEARDAQSNINEVGSLKKRFFSPDEVLLVLSGLCAYDRDLENFLIEENPFAEINRIRYRVLRSGQIRYRVLMI